MNKLDQFYSKIDEKTYTHIKDLSYLTGIALFNFDMYAVDTVPLSLGLFIGISAGLLVNIGFSMGKYGYGGILKTTTGRELESLYHEFLKNYCQLNHFFELDNPIQIQSMFNYLLEKGYLSQN